MAWSFASTFGLLLLIGSISAVKLPKIIQGEKALVKNFPYIVSIRSPSGRHLCGGSIISNSHILTAAHCVYGENSAHIKSMRIHSGTSRSDRPGNVHKIASVHIHPTYNERREVKGSDDIAVITLEGRIVFDKHQQKINLPSHDVEEHQVADVVGWGRQSTSSWEAAKQLQKLRVVLLPSNKCAPFLANTNIDEKQVCSFRSDAAAPCHGDSGSPLVVKGVIVGLDSRGDSGQCADGHPEIYTNVFAFKDFIKSVMNK